MRLRHAPKNRAWLVRGLIGLALVVATAKVLHGVGQKSSPPSTQPKIAWTPLSVTETVGAGLQKTVRVSFVASQPISSATVRVVPELVPVLRVDPPTLVNLATGKPGYVDLIFSPAATLLPETINGTIQIRDSGNPDNVLVKPLPVTLNIVWRVYHNTQLGVAFTVPPTFISSELMDLGHEQVVFSVPPGTSESQVVMAVHTLVVPSGLSLRLLLSHPEAVSIGGREYLKSFEPGLGDGAWSYATMVSQDKAIIISTRRSSFLSSPAFTQILSSLTFPTP